MMWYNGLTDLKRDLELDLTEQANRLRRRVESTVLERAKGVTDSRLFRAYIAYHNPEPDAFPFPYYRTRSNSKRNRNNSISDALTTEHQQNLFTQSNLNISNKIPAAAATSINKNAQNKQENQQNCYQNDGELYWEKGVNLARVKAPTQTASTEKEIGNVTVRIKSGR